MRQLLSITVLWKWLRGPNFWKCMFAVQEFSVPQFTTEWDINWVFASAVLCIHVLNGTEVSKRTAFGL